MPEIQFNTTLWNMVANKADLGRLRLRDPRVNVVVTKDRRTNLRDVFGSLRTSGNLVDRLRGHTLDIELIDLEIHVRTEDSSGDGKPATSTSWAHRVGRRGRRQGRDAAVAGQEMQAAGSHRIDAGPVQRRAAIRGAAAGRHASPEGAVSVDLKEGAIPLDQPRKLNLTGALTIHDVSVGPGADAKLDGPAAPRCRRRRDFN